MVVTVQYNRGVSCQQAASHEQLADTRHTKQTLVWVMLTTSITLADSYERYARLVSGYKLAIRLLSV